MREDDRIVTAAAATCDLARAFIRRAGARLGRADRSDTVDSIVVAAAIESGGAGILDGDPADLTALADG